MRPDISLKGNWYLVEYDQQYSKCTKYNIFIGLEDRKYLINEYQQHCDMIKKLIHAEKRVLGTVRINLVWD